MTTGNNGAGAAPKQVDRDEVIRLSTYYAAVFGWHDTSIEAQQSNALTISVVDMAPYEAIEPGEFKFYVMIDHSGYEVTRRVTGAYEVTTHDQIEAQRVERELREAVMDMALWYVTGEGAGYTPDRRLSSEQRALAREQALAELLEDEEQDEARYGGPIVHAVLTEVEPSLMIAPGDEDSPAPIATRQWQATFGTYVARCDVGFFGYDKEDGSPFLVATEADEDDFDEWDEAEEEQE